MLCYDGAIPSPRWAVTVRHYRLSRAVSHTSHIFIWDVSWIMDVAQPGLHSSPSATPSINLSLQDSFLNAIMSSDSRFGGRGFGSPPCHVAVALGKQFTLTFPSPPTCKMVSGQAIQLDVRTPASDSGDQVGPQSVSCSLDARLTSMEKVTALTLNASRPYGKQDEFDPLAAIDLWSSGPQVVSQFKLGFSRWDPVT
ncbi:hypothetical protein ElyMa_006411000 [Elysia marginata]|uniref:Uncharacterized protein n=1 Tax=Elysia marginata TaxID=1093978 RepID=A0AAV4HRX8_9GAST|nr:hypothetical protein ElyMa_006411000 [Elysia marginata]